MVVKENLARSLWWVVLWVLIAVLWLAGIARSTEQFPGRPADHVLVLGTESDNPPFSFTNNHGHPSGYNVAITNAIALAMGLAIDIKIASREELRQALERGEIDAIVGVYFSTQQDLVMDFTPALESVHQAVFIREGSSAIDDEAALLGLDMIVVQGDIMYDYVLTNGLSTAPVVVPTPADALRLLAGGKHDCALLTELSGYHWLRELDLPNVTTARASLNSPRYCLAVAEGNTDLKRVLTEGVARVIHTGRELDIYDRWLDVLEPRGLTTARLLRGVAVVGVPLLTLVFLAFFTQRSIRLKQQVTNRTRDLRERAEELQCLYGISESILRHHTIAELLREVVELIPAGCHDTPNTRARIVYDGRVYHSDSFDVAESRQSVDLIVDNVKCGSVEIYSVGEPRLELDNDHLGAERDLVKTIGRLLSEVLQSKVVERQFRANQAQYHILFQQMFNGVALHEIICDAQGNPVNYRFLDVNPAFEQLTGLTAKQVVGKTVLDVLPAAEMEWIQRFGKVALTGERTSFEGYSQDLDRHLIVSAFKHGPNRFACIYADISDRRRYEESLKTHRARLQSLAIRLATTEDNLRQKIADGLHDCIGQDLAALKLSVDIMRLNKNQAEMMEVDGTTRNALDQISQSIAAVVQEIWSLSFQLCPPGLYEAGLVPALEWLIDQFNSQYEFDFRLEIESDPLALNKELRGALFQMIRELLVNAIKHSGASSIKVVLSMDVDSVLVSVIDNGRGFDYDAELMRTGDLGGFGLFSLRERLSFMSGKLEIESSVGDGTRITIHFPLAKSQSEQLETSDEKNQDFVG